MTAPVRDVLRLDGETWAIEFGPHRETITALFTMDPARVSTACAHGWYVDLAIVDDELWLDAIHLYGGRATVATPGRGVSPGGAPVAVRALMESGLTLPEPEPGPEPGIMSHVGVGAFLLCTGTMMVGRIRRSARREAMFLTDRRRLQLIDGRLER